MMRRCFATLGWVLSLAVCGASARATPDPGMLSGNIFPLQQKHVHSSSIVELPDGDLLACWYHGSGERQANDVRVLGSRWRRDDSRWGPTFTLADTPGLPDCNPVLFVDRRGRLWLFWIVVVANRWEHSLLKYRRADDPGDDGAPRWTWQDTIQLLPGDGFQRAVREGFRSLELEEDLWAEYAPPYSRGITAAAGDAIKRQTGWMTRTHPVVLPTGRILLPLYSDGFNLSLMAISDDGGDSWRASSPIVGLGPIQPTVLRRKDGTLLALHRDSGNAPARVLQSISKDDGVTWSPAVDTRLPNPGSSLEAIALRSGRWLLVCNDTERGRHRLSVAISSDEGASWTPTRPLAQSEPGGSSFSYPSVLQSRDGTVHVTYTLSTPSGKSIRHARLGSDWLRSIR